LGKFQHIVFFKTKDGLEYTTLKWIKIIKKRNLIGFFFVLG
jgi:hypothetical protein